MEAPVRVLPIVAAVLLHLGVAPVRASTGEIVFSDNFDSGSICAWSNDVWYQDVDGDLFGDSFDEGVPSDCPPPEDHVLDHLDCDDSMASVNPLATEVCNAVDDDCDGAVDADDAGLLQPSCEDQDGTCSGSVKPLERCTGGVWDPCTAGDYAANSPFYELDESSCDGRDNDCDGEVDEGCPP